MRLILAGIVVAVASALALTACNSNEQKNGTRAQPQSAAPVMADGVRRVTPAELQDLLTRNEAIVIDVRTDSAYQAGHVKGARFIPEAEVAKHSVELPKDKLIVTYCS
jgi:predicted sulfurtransferase